MKTITKYSIILFTLVILGACEKYNLPVIPAPSKGTADFTKTVVVGSSIPSGFMNGALYTDGQKLSISALLAAQMKLAGGGDFNQPDIAAAVGYYGSALGIPGVPDGTPLGRLYLKNAAPPANPACTTAGPGPQPKVPGNTITPYAGDKTKLNNFSAYGVTIQTAQIAAVSGPPGNPAYSAHFARFAVTPSVNGTTGSTMISDAAAALTNNGTFFTFWLGIDDAYAYALNGADQTDATKPLTSTPAFNAAYPAAVNAMLNAKASAKGVLVNIPYPKDLPYFTAVSTKPIIFLSCDPVHVGTVANLTSLYNSYNGAVNAYVGTNGFTQAEADKRKILFHTGTSASSGANYAVINDETLTDLTSYLNGISPSLAPFGFARQTTAADLLTLTAGSALPTGVGVSSPLPDKFVLLPSEQTQVQASIDAFNVTIAAQVTAAGDRLALLDLKTEFAKITRGEVAINGAALSSSVAPPFGGWSLDGLHLNARGNGYVANLLIGVINAKWTSTIPLCNPNDYAGNELPVP